MKRINNFFQVAKIIAFAALFTVISFAGCEKYVIEGPEKPENVSFETNIIPIFSNNCISCHGGGISPNLKADFAYTSLTNGGYLNVANPESSELYDKLINSSSHQSKTTAEEKLYILTWIEEGAKNN